jgi:pilus assembly protein CpaB
MQSRVLAILVAVVLALVATAALVVYVNGADRRAISGQEPKLVWVAAKTITAGTNGVNAINLKLIEQREIPTKSVVEGGVVSLSQIQNRTAAVDIVAGEQLLLKRWVAAEDVAGKSLLPIEQGYQALSIGVDVVRQVAGFVTPGDWVSMVLTVSGSDEGGSAQKSQVLLPKIQVLAIGATALANASSQGGGGRVNQGKGGQSLTAVTLAVPDEHIERVVFAAEHGSIYLTLLRPDAKPAPGTGVTEDNVFPKGP